MNKPQPEGASIRDQLLTLAQRHEGVSTAELTEFDRHKVARVAWRLATTQDRLYRGGAGSRLRFFTSQVDAAHYTSELQAADKLRQKAHAQAHKERKKPGPKPKLAVNSALPGVSIKHYGTAPWARDAQPIITSETKVTLCPSPPHFGPAAKIHGCGV